MAASNGLNEIWTFQTVFIFKLPYVVHRAGRALIPDLSVISFTKVVFEKFF